ncbi:MAG: hypothetical protein HC794_03085 [Nitrospiraceae bacterium]|nr:hypothetical protein [Nitrospiraceae bacterium]
MIRQEGMTMADTLIKNNCQLVWWTLDPILGVLVFDAFLMRWPGIFALLFCVLRSLQSCTTEVDDVMEKRKLIVS